jgi:transcriptional regulator with XRE-family HTH domain
MAEEVQEVTTPDMTEFLDTVAERIQKVREFRGMSRRELGEALGLSGNSANTSVYAIEVGGNSPRLGTIYKLAKALDVSPGFLLDGGELKVAKSSNF